MAAGDGTLMARLFQLHRRTVPLRHSLNKALEPTPEGFGGAFGGKGIEVVSRPTKFGTLDK